MSEEFKRGSKAYEDLKAEALAMCGVGPSEDFDAKAAARGRIDYLKKALAISGQKGFVLGISGGVDSTVAGRLCQLACEELRAQGREAFFVAMRLPAGVQRDEEDAQEALRFIRPDKVLVVNVGPASSALSEEVVREVAKEGSAALDESKADFAKGNVKARLRMAAQYEAAGLYGALVVGTDHNSENATGFFTKWGDGACDLIVLNGLNKTQVRLVARELGAPERLAGKLPTADLEELRPGKLDDEGFGFEYAKLDRFLEGKEIDGETEAKILKQFAATRHKRAAILSYGAI